MVALTSSMIELVNATIQYDMTPLLVGPEFALNQEVVTTMPPGKKTARGTSSNGAYRWLHAKPLDAAIGQVLPPYRLAVSYQVMGTWIYSWF